MQELIPPSVDPVEHEAEAVHMKQNYENRTRIRSIQEILLDIDAEELPTDVDAIDSMENAWAEQLSFSGLNHEDELIPELSVNSGEGEEFSLGENGDVPKYENPDVGVEAGFKKEKPSSHQVLGLQSLDTKNLCETSLSSGSGHGHHENTQAILLEVSPFCLVHDEGLELHQELGSNCVDVKQPGYSVHGEGFQYTKELGTACGTSAETDRLYDPLYPLVSTEQVLSVEPCKNEVPTCPVHVEGSQSLLNSEMNCSNSTDKTDCASGSSKLLTAEQVFSVETGDNKQPACSANCEGRQPLQELGATCHYFENEIYSPYDPLHPLRLVEPNLSFQTCENKAPGCSIHSAGCQSSQELGSTYSKSSDETAESTSDALYPVLSFKQILSVETCENKSLACSVHCESVDETERAFDPLHPCLFAESVLSVEKCEIKTPGCPVYNEGSQSLQEPGTTCHKSVDHCASNPPQSLLCSEQVLSAETCENEKPVQYEHLQLSEKSKPTFIKSAEETEYACEPPNLHLSAEQVLSVETCENKVTSCSLRDEGFQSPKNLEVVCSDCEAQTNSISGHLISSEHSCENKVANMALVCFRNSLVTEACYAFRLSSTNIHIKEKICNPIGNAHCVQSVNSIPLAPCLNGSTESGCSSTCDVEPNGGCPVNLVKSVSLSLFLHFSFLIYALAGLKTSEINETVSQSGPMRNKNEQSWEPTQLEDFISFRTGM